VKKADLFGPPPLSRRSVETGSGDTGSGDTGSGDLVWRCGTGKNPHLDAQLVPESQDPLRQDNR
jgi:hypothetical protein